MWESFREDGLTFKRSSSDCVHLTEKKKLKQKKINIFHGEQIQGGVHNGFKCKESSCFG